MTPNVTGKRRRPETADSTDDPDTTGGRPSPHRPQDLLSVRRSQQFSSSQAASPSPSQDQAGNSRAQYTAGLDNGSGGRIGAPAQTVGIGQDTSSSAQSPHAESTLSTQLSTSSQDPSNALSQAQAQSKSHGQSRAPPTQSQPSTQSNSQFLAASTSPKALDIPQPLFYEVLTDDRLGKMQEGGVSAVLEAFAKAYQDGNPVAVSELYQEVLRSGLDNRLDAAQAGSLLSKMIESAPANSNIEAAPLLMDTLSILPERYASSPLLKIILKESGVSPDLMRLTLEDGLLRALGLTRDTFGRMFVRKQTHILYRQSNYNLLREETEGYSKLLTELFTVPQPDVLPSGVVEQTLENIKALIGAFDLDAGRVLDVTLDVFANMLVKKNRFFVKFLRASPFWPQSQPQDPANALELEAAPPLPLWALPDHAEWEVTEAEAEHQSVSRQRRDAAFWEEARASGMSAFFALGGRKVLNDAQKSSGTSTASQNESNSRGFETAQWIAKTGTLPPQGNAVAAQLLGFKLRFYASSARDKDDIFPLNLVRLAALLIKIGFISLKDLYAHLYPEDDAMPAVKEKLMRENEELERARRPGGGAMNALARAGVLSDDGPSTLPNPRLPRPETRASTPSKPDGPETRPGAQGKVDEPLDPLPEPSDQKAEMLRSLLLLGALPESLYIIGRFPWLMDTYPDLAAHVHRILHHSLSQVYERLRPIPERATTAEAAMPPASNQSGLSKGEMRLADPTKAKPRKWAQIDKYDADNNEGGDLLFRFYWDDWSNDIPVCQDVDDIFTLCNTLLNLSGVKIGRDHVLLAKLARIGKHSLTTDQSDSNSGRWIDLLKRLLCPALSVADANPGVVCEVFELLKMFPTQTRFAIYAEWFQGQTSRLPDISNAFAYTRARTKAILKRINKQNTRSMARELSKVSFSAPGVVFEVCLKQIESYENLIDVVIECARYFSLLSYDVLTWTIMSFLGREGRSRVSQTGFTANKWLQALSTFTGQVYKRYALMNPLPILRYVFDQIRLNNYTDLRVLRDLINSMAGIAADTDFSESQVLAMAGGKILRSLTLQQLSDKRHECKASAKRLLRTIVDNNLAGPILVAVAQQRQTCVFNHDQDDTKILGETFDEVVVVLTQYLDLLTEHLGPEQFTATVPSVANLIGDFGLDPSMAFTIHRNIISRQMTDYDAAHKPSPKSARPVERLANAADADTKMTDVLEKTVGGTGTGNTAEVIESIQGSVDTTSEAEDLLNGHQAANAPPVAALPGTNLVWHPILEELAKELEPMLSHETKSVISIPFFATFWQLDLSDIMAPSISYDEEMNRQRSRLASITADRSDMTTAGLRKKDAEKKDINDTLERLLQEMKLHVRRYQTVRARLLREKDHWFKGFNEKMDDLNMGLLQECFLPRLLISPIDALYTQRMLFLLHSIGPANFRLGRIMGRLFNSKTLTNLIFQATRREADNLGRFLFEVLRTLSEWHADKSEFEKKAHGPRKDLPGFASKLNAEGKPEAHLDFEEFRKTLRVWQQHVFSALKNCLASPEYMHARNAIQILNRVVKVFPAIDFMGLSLLKELKSLEDREKSSQHSERQDLTTAARSLYGQLKPREKYWIMLQDFCINESSLNKTDAAVENGKVVSGANAPKQADSEQSSANATGTQLNREAASSLDSERPDAEDGELQDLYGQTRANPKTSQFEPDPSGVEGISRGKDPVNSKPSPSEKRVSEPSRSSANQHMQSRFAQGPPGTPETHKRKSGEVGQDSDKASTSEPNKRARINEAGHASRADVSRTYPPDRRPYQRRGPGEQDEVLPPSMPRSDRPAPRVFDAPRGPPKHRDLSYGRLNVDQDSTTSALGPGRLSRPDYPAVEDRQSSNNAQPGHAAPDGRGAPTFSERPARMTEARRGGATSSPSVNGPDTVAVHPSRLQHIEGPSPNPMQVPQATSPSASRAAPPRGADYPSPGIPSPTVRDPPSGPANAPGSANFGRGDNRRQFAKVQETLRQGGQSGPSGPRPASQYPSGPAYDRQVDPQLAHNDERDAGAALARETRGRQGGSRPGTSSSDPQEALPASAQRGGFAGQERGPLSAPRGQREDGRYVQEPLRPYAGRHPSPGRHPAANDRGTSIRGRASAPQIDGRSVSGGTLPAERQPASRAPAIHHASERRDAQEYGGSFPSPYRSHRDDRPDLISRDSGTIRRERAQDDHTPVQRTPTGMDGRQRHYERDSPRDTRDMAADRSVDKKDFSAGPPRNAYESNHLRGAERVPRRGPDMDLMRDHSSDALSDRVTPREGSMRERRGDDRSAYGREDAMATYQDHRGPPAPRRGGGPPILDGRNFADARGEGRRSDYSRDRREPMNGGGLERRKREWNEEGSQGDSKRLPPRRPMN